MSSTASVYSELNNVAYSTPTTGGSSVTLTFTVSPASGSPSTTFHLECSVSGGTPGSVEINVDSSPVAVCSSSPCSYDGSFPAGNHTATCTANVGGNTYTKNASFSVVDNPPSVSAVATDVGGGSYELNCSATDDVQLSQISIYLDGGSTPEKTCSFSGVSGTCSKTVSVAAGSHELNCVAVDSIGNVSSDVQGFTVSPTNQPPVAQFTYTISGTDVTFDASSSHDPDGSIVSYHWDFGDGTTGSGKTVSHHYTSPGSYNVTLTVVDDDGATGTSAQTVSISSLPNASPTISNFACGSSGMTVTCSADLNDPDGDVLTWVIDFGGGSTSTGSFDPTTDSNPVIWSHTYKSSGTYTVELNVVDPSGAYDVATQSITVSASPADTTPPSVALDGVPTAWQNTDATISVVCNDSDSGCDSSSYRVFLSNAEISTCPSDYTQYTYISPAIVSSHVWACGAAKDNAGNVGFSGAYEINVDKMSPVTQVSLSKPVTLLNGETVQLFKVVCADFDSGCDSVYYAVMTTSSCPLPGSSYTPATTGSLHCYSSSPCTYYVCTYAVDNAGNQETPHATKVTLPGSVKPSPGPIPPGPIPPPFSPL